MRARPLLTTVSYYPNESELPSREWSAMERSFANWGQQGTASAYADAYEDFLAIRPQIPFYRKWERDLYSGLGLAEDETAWLPFFKLPMKQGSSPDVDGIDAQRDLNELWDQLNLLKPEVILLQSDRVANVLRERLRNLDFIVAVEVQKIPQFISSEKRRTDIDRIVGAFKPHIDKARSTRAAQLTEMAPRTEFR